MIEAIEILQYVFIGTVVVGFVAFIATVVKAFERDIAKRSDVKRTVKAALWQCANSDDFIIKLYCRHTRFSLNVFWFETGSRVARRFQQNIFIRNERDNWHALRDCLIDLEKRGYCRYVDGTRGRLNVNTEVEWYELSYSLVNKIRKEGNPERL